MQDHQLVWAQPRCAESRVLSWRRMHRSLRSGLTQPCFICSSRMFLGFCVIYGQFSGSPTAVFRCGINFSTVHVLQSPCVFVLCPDSASSSVQRCAALKWMGASFFCLQITTNAENCKRRMLSLQGTRFWLWTLVCCCVKALKDFKAGENDCWRCVITRFQ